MKCLRKKEPSFGIFWFTYDFITGDVIIEDFHCLSNVTSQCIAV